MKSTQKEKKRETISLHFLRIIFAYVGAIFVCVLLIIARLIRSSDTCACVGWGKLHQSFHVVPFFVFSFPDNSVGCCFLGVFLVEKVTFCATKHKFKFNLQPSFLSICLFVTSHSPKTKHTYTQTTLKVTRVSGWKTRRHQKRKKKPRPFPCSRKNRVRRDKRFNPNWAKTCAAWLSGAVWMTLLCVCVFVCMCQCTYSDGALPQVKHTNTTAKQQLPRIRHQAITNASARPST